MLRLSGILWAADPYNYSDVREPTTDEYDNEARALLIWHENSMVTFEKMQRRYDNISRKYATNAVQYLWCERRQLALGYDDWDDNIYRLSGLLWAEDVSNYIDRCDELAYDLAVAASKWPEITADRIITFFIRQGIRITPYVADLIHSFLGLVRSPIVV